MFLEENARASLHSYKDSRETASTAKVILLPERINRGFRKYHKSDISDIFVPNYHRGVIKNKVASSGHRTHNTDHHWFTSLMLIQLW